MKFHPVVHTLPPLSEAEVDRLEQSILSSPSTVRVTVWNDQCIDGFHRIGICDKHGILYGITEFKGTEEEAIAHGWKLNDSRRHMNEENRAIAGAKIANMLSEAAEKRMKSGTLASNDARGKSSEKASELTHASPKQIERAQSVLANGTPKLVDAVQSGEVSVSDAAKIVDEPAKVQNKAVDAVLNGRSSTVANAVKPKLLCRPCRVNGAKPNCKACKEMNASKPADPVFVGTNSERSEPGDDAVDPNEPAELDAEGTPIPSQALIAFERAEELTALCREIDNILHRAEAIAKGPGGRLIRIESVKQQFKDAKGNLWANRATHVCPYCGGVQAKKPCECCKNEGWVNKTLWVAAPGNNGKSK